ncbi:TPA: SDR family NAD(P)-dependent oxidoreductase [Pseudomonas aeruginosa]
MSEFNDRFAVVTGASSGIGLKLTETLLGHGATVLAMARREGPPESLHAHSGKRLHWLAGDVTRERDLDALAWGHAEIRGKFIHLVCK